MKALWTLVGVAAISGFPATSYLVDDSGVDSFYGTIRYANLAAYDQGLKMTRNSAWGDGETGIEQEWVIDNLWSRYRILSPALPEFHSKSIQKQPQYYRVIFTANGIKISNACAPTNPSAAPDFSLEFKHLAGLTNPLFKAWVQNYHLVNDPPGWILASHTTLEQTVLLDLPDLMEFDESEARISLLLHYPSSHQVVQNAAEADLRVVSSTADGDVCRLIHFEIAGCWDASGTTLMPEFSAEAGASEGQILITLPLQGVVYPVILSSLISF